MRLWRTLNKQFEVCTQTCGDVLALVSVDLWAEPSRGVWQEHDRFGCVLQFASAEGWQHSGVRLHERAGPQVEAAGSVLKVGVSGHGC